MTNFCYNVCHGGGGNPLSFDCFPSYGLLIKIGGMDVSCFNTAVKSWRQSQCYVKFMTSCVPNTYTGVWCICIIVFSYMPPNRLSFEVKYTCICSFRLGFYPNCNISNDLIYLLLSCNWWFILRSVKISKISCKHMINMLDTSWNAWREDKNVDNSIQYVNFCPIHPASWLSVHVLYFSLPLLLKQKKNQ